VISIGNADAPVQLGMWQLTHENEYNSTPMNIQHGRKYANEAQAMPYCTTSAIMAVQ
jgi:hypothetical protein